MYVLIVWTFDDEQRWEGPCDRWVADLLLTNPPPGARRARLVPWDFPLRPLAWAPPTA